MKYKSTLDLFKPRRSKPKHVSVLRLAVVSAAMLCSNHIFAQEKEWFFDIEVVVYKRDQVPSELAEQFPQGLTPTNLNQTFDLFAPFVKPDLTIVRQHLPVCGKVPTPELVLQFQSQWDLGVLTPIEWDPNWFSIDHLLPPAVEDPETEDQTLVSETEQREDSSAGLIENEALFERTEEVAIPLLFEIMEVPQIEYRDQLGCIVESNEHKAFVADKVPTDLHMTPSDTNKQPQLLSSEDWQLSDLAKSLNRQRGLQVMLHTAWRQQVLFGRETGPSIRLYAGNNFAKTYAADGQRLQEPQTFDESLWTIQTKNTEAMVQDISLIDQIRLALASPEPLVIDEQLSDHTDHQQIELEELWELDGSLGIFLRYINRTPYLHIDGNLDFRAPIFSETPQTPSSASQALPEPDRLQSYGFSQLRRVISKQVHYFDHPMFGLIVQIRRYDMPEDNSEQESQ